MKKQLKCYIYTRVSTSMQVDGYSLDETVVLLSKGMVDNRKVKVDFSLEDMDLSEFKGKATYE